ncbi:hypothetical protein N8500_08335 [Candidatus Puniceispirillum sp.]|nr:hypothetical protein [Candidatus Puniceispirillum sp.]
MTQTEFKFIGQTMEKVTIYFGLFFISLATLITLAVPSGSYTSMIPAILGIPITINGFLATQMLSKIIIIMHIVVLLGLVVFFRWT